MELDNSFGGKHARLPGEPQLGLKQAYGSRKTVESGGTAYQSDLRLLAPDHRPIHARSTACSAAVDDLSLMFCFADKMLMSRRTIWKYK